MAASEEILKNDTLVKLHGLKSAKELNGRFGYIRGYDKSRERYQVACGEYNLKSLKVKNLELIRQPEEDHRPGDMIEIAKIKSCPAMNGLIGEVCWLDYNSGRYIISYTLEGDPVYKGLKFENIVGMMKGEGHKGVKTFESSIEYSSYRETQCKFAVRFYKSGSGSEEPAKKKRKLSSSSEHGVEVDPRTNDENSGEVDNSGGFPTIVPKTKDAMSIDSQEYLRTEAVILQEVQDSEDEKKLDKHNQDLRFSRSTFLVDVALSYPRIMFGEVDVDELKGVATMESLGGDVIKMGAVWLFYFMGKVWTSEIENPNEKPDIFELKLRKLCGTLNEL